MNLLHNRCPALLLQIPLFQGYWNDVLRAHSAVASQPIEAWEVKTNREKNIIGCTDEKATEGSSAGTATILTDSHLG
jgi:hypothetical protein